MFRRYPDITNGENSTFIEKVKNVKYAGKWQVSEKIHGSNMAIYVDLKSQSIISYSSREGELKDTDDFYNFKEVIDTISPDVYKLCDNLLDVCGNRVFESYHTLAIYGELFGGAYNHPDVKPNPNAKRVQKGIFYTPDNYYLVFDAALLRNLTYDEQDRILITIEYWENELKNSTDKDYINNVSNIIKGNKDKLSLPYVFFLNYFSTVDILKDTNLRMAPLIGVYDKLEDALKVPVEFESNVYKYFNLPPIQNNYAEGIVIKPVDHLKLPNGDRVIIKCKNKRFSETRSNRPKVQKKDIILSDTAITMLEHCEDYTNINRLNNVLSKLQNLTKKDFGRVLKLFQDDIMKDIEKDYGDLIDIIKKNNEYKDYKLQVDKLTAKFFRDTFLNMVPERLDQND